MNIKRTLAALLSVTMAAVTCVTTASMSQKDTNIVTAADDCNDDQSDANPQEGGVLSGYGMEEEIVKNAHYKRYAHTEREGNCHAGD